MNFGTPLAISDVDDDGIGDLLFPGKLSNDSLSYSANQIILVSGKSGIVLGTPYTISQCYHDLTLANYGGEIFYSCFMEDQNGNNCLIMFNLCISSL